MRLLYVEDDLSMARTMEILMQQLGYDFDTATCGRDAIDLATKNAYDLILLDIMLPDLDGYEVIDRLRQSGVETPFLVQTALLDREAGADGTSLGVADYLIKPYNENEFIEKVKSALMHARAVSSPGQAEVAETAVTNVTPVEEVEARLEQRQQRRFKTLKSGQVVWPSTFSFVIMNMSYGGLAMRLPSASQELPEKFAISLSSGDDHVCELIWRLGDKAGVKFL